MQSLSKITFSEDNFITKKLNDYLKNYKVLRKSTSKYEKLINRFDWSNMVKIYDKTFEKYSKN